jgi:hypothetical protein
MSVLHLVWGFGDDLWASRSLNIAFLIIIPLYRQLEGSPSPSSFVRLARPGLLSKFEEMNHKNLDKRD